MKYLDNRQITIWVTEGGLEYRLTAKQGQYQLFIVNDRPDNFELSINEWGNTVHDSVPFPSLLEALRAAEAIIQEHLEITEQGYDAHIAEQEARLNESLDHEEDKRTIDRARDLLDSISESLYILSDFESEFLLALAYSPLPKEFEKHLKPESKAAFENFKEMGLVGIQSMTERYHVTLDGRKALGLPVDPLID